MAGMTTRTATQLTVTIPDGALPGSILSIPIKGRAETVKARVPEGFGPGSTLILTQQEGSDEWLDETPARSAQPMAVVPGAVVGLDLNGNGLPDLIVAGPDLNLPDVLQQVQLQQSQESQLSVQQTEMGLVPEGPVAYTVRLDTSVGVIDIIVRPDWAPYGARRFLELAAAGDLDGLSFYRSVKGCLAQFGLPAKRPWQPLPDDPPNGVPFLLGAVCFAAMGRNSRKSTLFICIGDMSHCFGQSPWETPIGAVAEVSLDVLDCIETIYGDIAECGGAGPNTSRINAEGNDYLSAEFPLLTYIRSARPLDWPPPMPSSHRGGQEAVGIVSEAPCMAPPPLHREPLATTVNCSGASQSIPSSRTKACTSTKAGSLSTKVPIDVHVEVVQPEPRRRASTLDVPVEISSVQQPTSLRRQTLGGPSPQCGVSRIPASSVRNRSSSFGGGARPRSTGNDSVSIMPAWHSSVSTVAGGQHVVPLALHSVSVPFDPQGYAKARALGHAQAEASMRAQMHAFQQAPHFPQMGSSISYQGSFMQDPWHSGAGFMPPSVAPGLSVSMYGERAFEGWPSPVGSFRGMPPGPLASAQPPNLMAPQLNPPVSPLNMFSGLMAPLPLSMLPPH